MQPKRSCKLEKGIKIQNAGDFNLNLAENRETFDGFVVISNEIHHLMSLFSELLSIHRPQRTFPRHLKTAKVQSSKLRQHIKPFAEKIVLLIVKRNLPVIAIDMEIEFDACDLHFLGNYEEVLTERTRLTKILSQFAVLVFPLLVEKSGRHIPQKPFYESK